ncbi:hypothetical protein GCM10022223_45660 [Kineosporia mesophila]|uniref:HNH endonuclease n=1 Tax=Kineosporia mesophila TaxID=566012 RepID=A0ABP7A2A6_9ACTN|nr:hypothetical protein [Kineosporia mesophila]MCD5348983.1 hypothetical protein [Kineosporia mesophila]
MSASLPDWTDSKLGTKKRAALWLLQVVGEGNIFTKSALRDAFPETTQIDRRMRDLRAHGWKIDTNREDISLDANQQRFIQQGEAVWEPGKGTPSGAGAGAIGPAQRRELLVQDGHKCRSCGISPGETYADTDITSQLDIARRTVRQPDGEDKVQLIVECNRCRVGNSKLKADVGEVIDRAAKLPAIEKKMLSSWIDQDTRTFSDVEQLWADYRTLPAEARDLVRQKVL